MEEHAQGTQAHGKMCKSALLSERELFQGLPSVPVRGCDDTDKEELLQNGEHRNTFHIIPSSPVMLVLISRREKAVVAKMCLIMLTY